MLKKLLNCTVEYDGFYFVSNGTVCLFDTYAEAKHEYDKSSSDAPKGIFTFVKYGNLKETLIGRDTNVSPFKQNYGILKDLIRGFILSAERKGTERETNAIRIAHLLENREMVGDATSITLTANINGILSWDLGASFTSAEIEYLLLGALHNKIGKLQCEDLQREKSLDK